MTRHSTLTNADDLHYAKAKTFSGDPLVFSPDFIDQILIATDTKEIYLATGTDSGELLKLGGTTNSFPPSSIATEWITFDQPITAEVGKSYLKTGFSDVFITLPTNALNGQSINFFALQNFLNVNSSGMPLDVGGQGNRPTPWQEYGLNRTRFIPPRQETQITYISGYWYVVSGSMQTRDYTP